MLFFLGLTSIGAGGILAVRAERSVAAQKTIETMAGVLLMAGLVMIGWGINFRF